MSTRMLIYITLLASFLYMSYGAMDHAVHTIKHQTKEHNNVNRI
jgi:hypothetical protein